MVSGTWKIWKNAKFEASAANFWHLVYSLFCYFWWFHGSKTFASALYGHGSTQYVGGMSLVKCGSHLGSVDMPYTVFGLNVAQNDHLATEPNRVVTLKKIFPFFLFKINVNILSWMISGWKRLEPAILGPLQPQKLPKLAIFDCFSLFDAKFAIFWAGTRWNSPIKVKT